MCYIIFSEEKYLVKYQILSKRPLVVVVYSLQDTAHACQKFTASGYKCIESGARNYEVRLPRFSECISSIESSDPSVEVSPQFEMPLPYTDLKNQTSIQHKVTLLTYSGGRHLLNLCLKRENEILRSEPFHVTLGADDLYDSANLAARDVVSNFFTNEGEPGSRQPLKSGEKTSQPQPSNTNQRQEEVRVPTADQFYDDIDEAYKNPKETQPKVPVGVIRRPQIEQYDDILLRQVPVPRARTSIYNSSLFTRLHDFDDEEWGDDDDETLYEDMDAERTSEMLTATRPRFPSPELKRLEQQDTTPLVSRTENTMPSLPLKPGTVRGILENHNVDNYWPLLERSGVKSVEDLARLDKKKLEEFGVKTVGDRIRIMNAVESCKSPFICSSKEKE
ncbi:uncharacterized protein LOC120328896 [Styela clava]